MALLDINLLHQQQSRLSALQQTHVLVAVVMATIVGLELLMGVFLVSTKALRANSRDNTKKEITQLQSDITALDRSAIQFYSGIDLTLTQEGQTYQTGVKAAGDLIDNHKYYTLYLSEIAVNTPSTIIYTSFSSPGTNQILVGGSAASYTDVSKLAASFKNLTFAKNVAIQNAKTGNTDSRFPIDFTLAIDLKSAGELNLLPKPGANEKINAPENSKTNPNAQLPTQ